MVKIGEMINFAVHKRDSFFMDTKYIFVTGGVVSSLGKGIISASIGKLLQARGYKVTIQKFDPYINIDPGTLNPYEHGECYVTEDGFETDLDLGHYERFTGIHTTRDNSITTGRIYKTVIDRERHGDYLGKTIQVVPHITDEIKRRMLRLSEKGTVKSEKFATASDDEQLDFVITRNHWRHRECAVYGGYPTVALAIGARCGMCASDVCALPEGRRRTEDQTHTTLREGVAGHGYTA